jgi:hypothetical protein
MKIRLIMDIPVSEEHGLRKGMILETFKPQSKRKQAMHGVWVRTIKEKPDDHVRILPHEFEEVA